MNVPAPDPRWWLGGLLLWICGAAWLLFTPAPELSTSGAYNDKLGHLALFALAGGWIAWRQPRWHSAWPWLLALLGFALISELVQLQLPTRSAEWADGIADGLGLVLGFTLVRPLFRSAEHVT